MPDVRQELRTLVERFGPGVLEDADELRSLLDDVLGEDASPAETNLLIDAVRYGAVDRMRSLVEHGAGAAAVAGASSFLAQQRGGTDDRSARWACEAIGHALDILPNQLDNPTQASDDLDHPTQVSDHTLPVTESRPGYESRTAPILATEPPSPGPSTGYRWVEDVSPPRRGSRRWPLVVGAGLAAVLVIIVVVATSMGEEGKPPATTATSPPGTSPAETTPAETSTSETSPPETAPPAPFESATLYEFARYLFDANECFVPEPGEFPVSEIIPDKERIKCDSNDLPYTGTFWCHSDREGLRADREVYLGFAVAGTDPVLPPPAGQRSPADGIQVAFNHTGSNQGRVYWDSPRRLCAGELQAEHEDVGATIDFWLAGRDG